MRASVIVCTYNRAHLLDDLLAALEAELAGADAEIVVVDNASTDGTEAVVRAAAVTVPLQYVLEPRLGLSHARNRGVVESTGEIVVFIDDDALPAPGWLAAHLRPYADDPRLGTVGGPIQLRYAEGVREPWWLSPLFHGTLGAYDMGPVVRPYDDGTATPPGGNMSLRRAALDEAGLFDTELGRSGDSYLAGEEFVLVHRLYSAGWSGRYIPEALAFHLVPAERLRLSWFRNRFHANWETSAALAERGFAGRSASSPLGSLLRMLAHDAARVVTGPRAADRMYWAVRLETHLAELARFLVARRRPWAGKARG